MSSGIVRRWLGGVLKLLPLVLLAALFVLLYPEALYSVAERIDREFGYELVIRLHSDSKQADWAARRLELLREDEVWQATRDADTIAAYRSYLDTYQAGDAAYVAALYAGVDGKINDAKYAAEAKERLAELADAEWLKIAQSKSEREILDFLEEYPETTMRPAAEARLQELYDDWGWVRGQDKLEHYEHFLARHPDHPERGWIAKRIIDLEVEAIASGEHGEMPTAQRVGDGDARMAQVEVEIENGTGYELTVRYSGKETSRKVVLASGATDAIGLPPGEYRVAASVRSGRVSDYYGVDQLLAGAYNIRFYIETRFSPTFTPGTRKRRSYTYPGHSDQ